MHVVYLLELLVGSTLGAKILKPLTFQRAVSKYKIVASLVKV